MLGKGFFVYFKRIFSHITHCCDSIFVVTEFAIVKIRGSKINQLIESGDKRAIHVQKLISNLDEYLSACQLGITITALGLGWLGEPTVEHFLHPLFEKSGFIPH